MIVIDSSVAVKWIFAEDHAEQALNLWQHAAQAGIPVVAPPLIRYEVANVIRQRMRREALDLTDALRRWDLFLTFQVELHLPTMLHRAALILADTYGLPAAYDAHYVVLAQHLGCDLWTDDQRLLKLLGGRLPFVHWIGAYQSAPSS